MPVQSDELAVRQQGVDLPKHKSFPLWMVVSILIQMADRFNNTDYYQPTQRHPENVACSDSNRSGVEL